MQRFVRLFGLLVAAAALAAPAAAVAGSSNGAGVYKQRVTITEPVSDVNPCTGEPFVGEGTVRLVTTVVSTPDGQVSHKTDVETARFQAVGATGARYVGAFAGPFENTYVTAGNGLYELVGGATFRVVRTGEDGTADDFLLHSIFGVHFDFTTGETTLSFFHSNVECA
jgi:hypothetical protein